MKNKTVRDYLEDAQDDARGTVVNFMEEIIDAIVAGEQASDDLLYDYPDGDSYHNENHTDRSYGLQEAADLLEQLHKYEETDGGLWEGQSPREAISTQAAYTYRNAVYSLFREMVSDINEDVSNGPLHDMVEDGADRALIEGRIKDIIDG